MTWSDDNFRRRVAERAKALGKSLKQVAEDAGISPDTLEKIPANGRRIDTLEKLAGALGWTLGEIIGYEHRVSVELLGAAFKVARTALRNAKHDETALIEVTAWVYNALTERHLRDGRPLDEITATLIAYISNEWQKG
jgi:transcriptional regulator with XRE-family HTH domain